LKAMVSRVIKPKRERPVPGADQGIREPVLRVIAGADTSSADQTGD